MPKLKKIAEVFDFILFCLWDVTTGAATNEREAFKGAVRYSRFLLSEIRRRDKLEEAGETVTARRGMTIPDSLFDAWLWNILEDCRYHKVPPPRAMIEVLYYRLGCTHLSRRKKSTNEEAKQQARGMVAAGQSLRTVAKNFSVNATTVLRWTAEQPHDFDNELNMELREMTGVERFYPPHRRGPESM